MNTNAYPSSETQMSRSKSAKPIRNSAKPMLLQRTTDENNNNGFLPYVRETTYIIGRILKRNEIEAIIKTVNKLHRLIKVLTKFRF